MAFESSLDSSGSEMGGGPFSPSFDAPDPTTMGVLSLALGIGYLVVTRRLDRHQRHGVATPFALATLPTMYVGTLLMADDLERSEEHTSELQSLMRISYAVFCLKKKKHQARYNNTYRRISQTHL